MFTSCARQRETRGVELRKKLKSGMMDLTQLRRCQGNDETARVHRVQCRVVFFEFWLKSFQNAEAMAVTSVFV